jgi:predicted enzyme related to lactoylglutathione lyase
MSTTPLGRFVWFDLMTSDPPAAIAFYTKVCGWETEQWKTPSPDMPPYTMWKAGESMIGGTMQLPPGAPAPPHWLGYISTPDLQGTVDKAKSLGATVMVPPTPIPTVGAFAVLADPHGAVFAAFAPAAETPGHDGPARVGEVSWVELASRDYSAALEFYGTVFGWGKLDAMDMGEGAGIYQMFGRNGVPMGGVYTIPPGAPFPPNWSYYIRVADLQAATDRATSLGATVTNGPMDVPGGDRITMFTDPQGAAFALHQVMAR